MSQLLKFCRFKQALVYQKLTGHLYCAGCDDGSHYLLPDFTKNSNFFKFTTFLLKYHHK